MPRNGSGVYGPPVGTTATPNTPIESAKYNAYVADAAEALTNSINANGTAPYQANQPMGGFKFTNLGAGAASGDSLTLGQAQSGIVAHASAVGGSADAISATFSPAFSAWIAKMRFRFTAGAANATATPTINVDGLGAKTIKKLNGVALGIGDIQGSGHVCDCVYDGTDVILLNPALVLGTGANVFAAKQTFTGPVVHGETELADAAAITWDLSAGGPNYKITITSNRTLGAFSGATAGQEGFLTVAQDGIGGWSLDLSNAAYVFFGPSIENIARGPNDETVYEYKVLAPGSMLLRRKGATTIGGSGRDLLAVLTANSSSTVDIVMSKWLQLYDRFEVDLEDIQAATDNVELRMRTSSNGGSSYDSGASDYAWGFMRVKVGGSDSATDAADSQISLVRNDGSNGLSNVAGETLSGRLAIHNPRSATPCKISWDTSHMTENSAGTLLNRICGAGVRLASADVDAVRISCSSGNIASGIFRLYGVGK